VSSPRRTRTPKKPSANGGSFSRENDHHARQKNPARESLGHPAQDRYQFSYSTGFAGEVSAPGFYANFANFRELNQLAVVSSLRLEFIGA
jgi:hypothetical protein